MIIKKWVCFLQPIDCRQVPDVICTIKDILDIALTDCFIDATQTVEPCLSPLLSFVSLTVHIHHPSLFSDIACSLAISTLSFHKHIGYRVAY